MRSHKRTAALGVVKFHCILFRLFFDPVSRRLPVRMSRVTVHFQVSQESVLASPFFSLKTVTQTRQTSLFVQGWERNAFEDESTALTPTLDTAASLRRVLIPSFCKMRRLLRLCVECNFI